jgi:hypothetical protein
MEVLFALVLAFGITFGFVKLLQGDSSSNSSGELGIMTFGIVFGILAVSFLIMGGVASQITVANEHMNFDEVDEMKQTASDDVRLLPMKVGDTYAQNRLQFERHKLSQGDITINEDGSMAWTYNIVLEGLANRWAIHQAGAVTVDMTQTDANVKTTEQEIVPGVGDFMGDNVYFELRKNNY